MISRVEREGSGTLTGSTRERMGISPTPCWMSARCGTGAPLVIQVKISGSASQKSLSGGSTGSWCDSMSDHIASSAWRLGMSDWNVGTGIALYSHFCRSTSRSTAAVGRLSVPGRGSPRRKDREVACVLLARAVFLRRLPHRRSNSPRSLLRVGRCTDEIPHAG